VTSELFGDEDKPVLITGRIGRHWLAPRLFAACGAKARLPAQRTAGIGGFRNPRGRRWGV